MRTSTAKIRAARRASGCGMKAVRSGLIALLVLGFGPVLELSAQDRRGAEIVIEKQDGRRVSGELIAVKPDSLLLLLDHGADVTVDRGDVRSVRIVRRSPVVLLTVAGFLLASGAVGLTSEPADEWGWFGAALAGVGGGIAGLASGLISGRDRRLSLDTGPGATAGSLDPLKGLSREGRFRVGPGAFRRPRFRLSLATTMGSFSDSWVGRVTEIAWSFAQAVPPEESGPRTAAFYQSRHQGQDLAAAGPLNVGIEWPARWAAEVELFFWSRGQDIIMHAATSFVSTADGRTYTGFPVFEQRAGIDYVLAGLAYRPFTFGRRGSLEIGIAAGPAWVKLGASGSLLPAEKKTVWAGRVRAVYDHNFSEALSLGVYAGYRLSGEARFAAVSVTQDLTFRDWNGGVEPAELSRRTEMTVPAREFSASRFVYGVRLGFRI